MTNNMNLKTYLSMHLPKGHRIYQEYSELVDEHEQLLKDNKEQLKYINRLAINLDTAGYLLNNIKVKFPDMHTGHVDYEATAAIFL